MLAEEFVRILRTFADNPEDIDISKGELLFQVREDVLEARLSQRAGELYVEENGVTYRSADWIIKRIARVPLLADRIISYVSAPEDFVTPSGWLLDQLEFAKSADDVEMNDAASATLQVLGRQPAATSSVLYLTSDAGEGKTTLINHLSRLQAIAFKEGKADWLLVPIPLGGRGFLRFDDVVVAALANRLRFQWWYFDSFLELVRMGVVVPAFDGFEEMFVEGSSGEALSALGNLMRSLQSQGTVLIAARKAYFEYQSFRTQARLFDTIGTSSVSFARLALKRWGRDKFFAYCEMRDIGNAEAIYNIVSSRLSPEHPLLTRPVLVRRLLDVVEGLKDIDGLLEQLGKTPRDYFYQFVNAIVEREAQDKWLTKSGDIQEPLLSEDEHYELLCMIAQEMWLSSTDALKPEVLDVISDLFSEANAKEPSVARQVKERLKQHSLITSAETVRGAFSFDHEDFRKFFLGEAMGRLLVKSARQEIQAVLGVGSFPLEATDHAIQYFRRHKGVPADAIKLIQEISAAELPTSFVRENAGALTIWLLDGETRPTSIEQMNFPAEAFSGKNVFGVSFERCYFQPTRLTQNCLKQCAFLDCQFERFEIAASIDVGGAKLKRCEIGSLLLLTKDEQIFDPNAIASTLTQFGVIVELETAIVKPGSKTEADDKTKLVEKFLRTFLRATYITENVIKLKMGQSGGPFLATVMPTLLRAGIVEETQYLGSGSQRRFKLRVPMEKVEQALSHSDGEFTEFVRLCS